MQEQKRHSKQIIAFDFPQWSLFECNRRRISIDVSSAKR